MLDTNGNRTAVSLDRSFAGGGATQLSGADIVTDAEDRLTQYGGVAFEHDSLGRIVTKTEGSAVTRYTWDSLGALKSVTLPDAKLIEYLTDAAGRRVGKRVDGVLQKRWVYRDALRPAAELDAAGNVVSRFVYADDAGAATTPQYVVRAGQTLRVVADQLGSLRLLVDATSGAVVERVERDEFGVVLSETAPGTVPFGFAGGFYDPDTGLVKFGAREYEPRSGRWMSRDPILFRGGQANLHVYVGNDPINKRDPRGTSVLLCRRVADLPLNSFLQIEHHFLAAGGRVGGAGHCGGGVPGHGGADLPFSAMCMNDHSSETSDEVICEEVNADEDCVAGKLTFGDALGPWAPPVNDCQTVAHDIIAACSNLGTFYPFGGSEGAPGWLGSEGGTLGY